MSGFGHVRLSPWFVAGMLGCCYAVAFIDRALVNVAAAPIKQDIGLSDTQFGLVSGTAFVVPYVLCGIPFGWLADRTDRRAIIALAIMVWTVMTAACGLAASSRGFFAARIGVGLGEAALVPAGMSLLGSSVPASRMARSIAIFLMGSAIGNAVALLAGGYLLTKMVPTTLPGLGTLAPWQALFLAVCPAGVVAAGLVLALREPVRAHDANGSDMRAAIRHIGAHRSAYGFLVGATCCTVMLSQGQAAWLPLFYMRHFGLQAGPSAMLVGIMYVLSVPTGQFAGGVLTDGLRARGVRWAPNAAIALCGTLAIPPAVIFCITDRLWVSEAGYVVFSFLVSATTPNGLLGVQLLTPRLYQGFTSALLVSIVSLVGVGIGPAAVGLLNDRLFHDEQALGLSLLIVIVTAGLLGPMLAMMGRQSFSGSVRHPA